MLNINPYDILWTIPSVYTTDPAGGAVTKMIFLETNKKKKTILKPYTFGTAAHSDISQQKLFFPSQVIHFLHYLDYQLIHFTRFLKNAGLLRDLPQNPITNLTAKMSRVPKNKASKRSVLPGCQLPFITTIFIIIAVRPISFGLGKLMECVKNGSTLIHNLFC